MNNKLGLAVVGSGMASLPHARALVELGDRIEVRGVFSRDSDRRSAFAAKWGFRETVSIEELADDPGVDAVLIITPPNARTELVERFARAGKHILMEKPVERTLEAAESIVQLCEKCGIKLGIVFQHRFRAASCRLAELMAQGSLGPLNVVQAHVPWWRGQDYYDEPGRGSYERDGGGVLISQAIHTLDLMLSVTGPASQVQAIAATTAFHRMESEDFVAGGIRFDNGAVGSVVASTAIFPGVSESITFGFGEATAHLESGTLTLKWHCGREESFGEPATTGGGADPMAFPHDWHRDLILDFAEAVLEDRRPKVTGRDGLMVHSLIDALVRSSKEGRAVSVDKE